VDKRHPRANISRSTGGNIMNIWAFVVKHEGNFDVSTHLTKKGALLVAVRDILEYLGVYEGYFRDEEHEASEPPWKDEQLAEMSSEQLSTVYQKWSEKTWDHFNYESEVIRTTVQG